jgi:16S rRNA (cytosine967-C5)-methyltransferase
VWAARSMPVVDVRARAAQLLSRILLGRRTTDQVFGTTVPEPLLQELVYGSLRHFYSLSRSVKQALDRPLRAKDHDVECLMIVGLYQLRHMRIPHHAAMHETVEAARHLRKPWAKGLVNAVLRRAPQTDPSLEHPRWMERMLRDAWGVAAEPLMRADNERAPMVLRVNRARIAPETYATRLREAGMVFRAPSTERIASCSWGPETLVLETPVPVARLPGHAEGLVSVQDAGAQLVAPLLIALIPNERDAPGTPRRVLDACAAPGGKLFHLMELDSALQVTALDSSAPRMTGLLAEAQRLGHTGLRTLVADAAGADWRDPDARFDAVLLDAPCSGSGTLRRHPDIKVLRQASELPVYAEHQRRLLHALWQTVKPGGTLLYCTCSVFPLENDDVIHLFLDAHTDAEALSLELPAGQPTRSGWQLLPTNPDTDGFYFAAARKRRP